MSEAEPGYDEIVARARAAAAAKRASGEVPEGTNEALDRLFVELAPAGARPAGNGLEDVVEMLARYRFDPAIPLPSPAAQATGMRGKVASLVKRAAQPLATWQLRHLTDQLNAYHLAEAELLRSLVEERGSLPPADSQSRPEASGASTVGDLAGAVDPAGAADPAEGGDPAAGGTPPSGR